MDKLAFSVWDSKAEFFSAPFFCRTKGEAIRSFMQIANDKQSQIGMHPEDFTLFHIGCFDEKKGEMKKSPVESLGVAINFVKSEVL